MARKPTGAPPATGDLFEHFGVAEREPATTDLPAPVPARACAGCTWIRPLPHDKPCEMCGAASSASP